MTDPTKKYEFTGETKVEFGVTLKRIRALITIPGVVDAGALGGWIEDERNLSVGVYGNAWVSITPLYLSGLTYPVIVTDLHMAIGCQVHAIAEWRAFDDRRIAEMDGLTGSHFWRDFGPTLLALCEASGRPMVHEDANEQREDA